MNRLLTSLAIVATTVSSCFTAHADEQTSNTSIYTDATFTVDSASESDTVKVNTSKNNLVLNSNIWKYKRKFMLGYTTGTLDQKKRFGGEISSRWGVSMISGRNIYLHRGPIGGFLKFGLNLDLNLNYMNFAKGVGSFSDIMHPDDEGDEDETVSLGRHYLTVGFAIGPTATFAPFYASSNRRLASLVFRPYFHVVPSYACYMISDEEDTELHNAAAIWCAAGMEIQWKRLIVGLEWKGSTAKYKSTVDSLISEIEDEYEAEKPHKFDMNMFNFSIGLAF